MTAQPTERDRATAAEVVEVVTGFPSTAADTEDTVQEWRDAIAAALAAEREAALRPVLVLADEIHARGIAEVEAMNAEPNEHRRNQYASRAATYARAEHRIRAVCSGQGDGADGPEHPQDGPAAPDRPTDTTKTTERR